MNKIALLKLAYYDEYDNRPQGKGFFRTALGAGVGGGLGYLGGNIAAQPLFRSGWKAMGAADKDAAKTVADAALHGTNRDALEALLDVGAKRIPGAKRIMGAGFMAPLGLLGGAYLGTDLF